MLTALLSTFHAFKSATKYMINQIWWLFYTPPRTKLSCIVFPRKFVFDFSFELVVKYDFLIGKLDPIHAFKCSWLYLFLFVRGRAPRYCVPTGKFLPQKLLAWSVYLNLHGPSWNQRGMQYSFWGCWRRGCTEVNHVLLLSLVPPSNPTGIHSRTWHSWFNSLFGTVI